MLSIRDKDSLEIDSFIFHILVKDEDDPQYLDEVILTRSQKRFFKKWFATAINNSIEYEFKDKERAGSVHKIAQEVGDTPSTFLDSSKSLAYEFKRLHKGSSSDGLLIVSTVEVESGQLLYLMKMDYSETLQYTLENQNGRSIATLKEVENPINENKQAIQKIAIINIDCENYHWDVIAQDKQSTIGYKIADYFKSFLDVREREMSSVLTREVFSAVLKWARLNKDSLDPSQNITIYKGRAINYLDNYSDFDTDEYVRAVVSDEDEERRVILRNSLRSKLVELELAGRSFEIRRNSIRKTDSKSIWTTAQNVQIVFEGTPDSKNISRTSQNGEEIVTIRTSNIEFK